MKRKETVLSGCTKFKPGDVVYYQGYLAEVLAIANKTKFRKVQRYLIDPYPEQMWRVVVKESELLKGKS